MSPGPSGPPARPAPGPWGRWRGARYDGSGPGLRDFLNAHHRSGRRHRRRPLPARPARPRAPDAEITVIGNTGDDIILFGLQVCPDLDTVMYTLGGGIHEEQGWGRADETFTVKDELAAYGAGPDWFGLGDRDFATHIVRTQMLDAGYPLAPGHRGAVRALAARACGCCR